MDEAHIQRRVERTIDECRTFEIEPDPRTIAEIMIDEDVTAGMYTDLSEEQALALVEYERAAGLTLGVGDRRSAWIGAAARPDRTRALRSRSST